MNSFFKIVLFVAICGTSNQISAQDLRLFPTYDSIIHYHLNYGQKETENSTEDEIKVKFTDEVVFLVTDGLNRVISTNFDSLFLHYNFSKTILNEQQCNLIDSVFIQKPVPDDLWLTEYTTPYFSDYFIFVQNGKAIGVIQISSDKDCFRLIGNKIDPQGFGLTFEIGKFMTAYQKTH